MATGVFNQFIIKHLDANRKNILKKYKNDTAFVDGFNVTPAMLKEMFDMAVAEGVEYNEEQAKTSEPLFKMIIKALIGRDLYNEETYYKVYNRFDPIYQRALEIINSDEYDKILK